MNNNILIITAAIFGVICLIVYLLDSRVNLNKIKSKKVGDNQFGSADWATPKELANRFKLIKFEPENWRQGINIPMESGTILGTKVKGGQLYAYLDTTDNHTEFVSAPSGGKTESLLYPNLEYIGAAGMSVFCTDTKGKVYKDFVPVLRDYYNFKCTVIDLRYPNQSDCINLMGLVNKYMDAYLGQGQLADKAKAEAYAKNLARTIIHMEGFKSAGQNQFFYDTAEAVISAITILCAELCPWQQRHIVSVFKIIRQLIEVDPSTQGKKDVQPQLYLQQLYKYLPENHISKDLLAPSATADYRTLSSIVGTAMSKLMSFIDSEVEQLICFDGELDIEEFAKGKQAIFFVVDEKFGTRNFIISLLVKQIYGELIKISDFKDNNKLDVRCKFEMDEFGTYDAIENADGMLSAGRSRDIIFDLYLQTLSQLKDKYGRDKAETMEGCCQNLMFSFQSPTSPDLKRFEEILGPSTVMTGSISKRASGSGGANESTSYSMTKKPLMSADEISSELGRGNWIFKSPGMHPGKMQLLKASDWGITFSEKYSIESKADRKVEYASRDELISEVRKKYPQYYYTEKTTAPAPKPSTKSSDTANIEEEWFNK